MRWQTTALLAAVLVALGAFYYVYEVRGGPERAKTAAQKGRLWPAEASDVTEVALRRGRETLRLRREGDGWQIVEPVKARGDRSRIDETLVTLTTARVDREIASAPTQVAEFGLDKPGAEVTLSLKDGRRLALTLGAKSPTGAWVYAREAQKPAVVALSESVLRDATRPLADFRDRTVLAYDQKGVSGFEIKTRDETLAVERVDGAWRLTRPLAVSADAETIGDFLDKLQQQKVKDFVAEAPKSLVPYGLDRPVRVAIHTGRDKERATKELLFGAVDAVKQIVYAMRPGEPSVLSLPERAWALLPKNVGALRNKVLVEVEREKVTRIELESPKGAVTLSREGDRWRVAAPEALPADQVEAGAILFKLRELRARAFLSDDATGIARYLAKPTVRVTLTERDAPAPTTLLLAPSPEKRGGQPSAYAAVAGKGPVVLVEGKALDELARSLTDLRDRTLLPGLEPRDVKRLRLSAAGATVVLERSGEVDWKFVEGATGTVKGASVENLLYALRALKWKALAAPGSEAAATYGLAPPAFEATLLRGDGTEIGAVLVGKRDGDVIYAKLKALPAVYAVDPTQLGPLPKLPDELKG